MIYDSEHEAKRKAFYSQFAQEIPDGMLATYATPVVSWVPALGSGGMAQA